MPKSESISPFAIALSFWWILQMCMALAALFSIVMAAGKMCIRDRVDEMVRKQIEVLEARRAALKVTELSFNSFFDYSFDLSLIHIFKGRPYTDSLCYLTITQEAKKRRLFSFDNKNWRDFLVKIRKVHDLSLIHS